MMMEERRNTSSTTVTTVHADHQLDACANKEQKHKHKQETLKFYMKCMHILHLIQLVQLKSSYFLAELN